MSYLLGGYGAALVILGGYVFYLVRQLRKTQRQLRELTEEGR